MIKDTKILSDTHKRIGRFLISGGSAAITEYIAFFVLHSLGMHILLANSFSFLTGLCVSFTLNKLWVFKVATGGGVQFGKYFVLALVNLLISDVLIWVAVHGLSTRPLIAKVITMASIAIWNYLIFSKLIFVESKKTD